MPGPKSPASLESLLKSPSIQRKKFHRRVCFFHFFLPILPDIYSKDSIFDYKKRLVFQKEHITAYGRRAIGSLHIVREYRIFRHAIQSIYSSALWFMPEIPEKRRPSTRSCDATVRRVNGKSTTVSNQPVQAVALSGGQEPLSAIIKER